MSAKRDFARRLLGRLWRDYAARVPYVGVYRAMLDELGAKFVNDHVAFRSLAVDVGGRTLGLASLERIFRALGWIERGELDFPETRIFARHFSHPDPTLPKVFLSELRVDELPRETARLVRESVAEFREALGDADVERIARIDRDRRAAEELLEKAQGFFREPPWGPPREDVLREVEAASQYGAWVLVHGFRVNHFTALVNAHRVEAIADVESLAAELRRRGVPMKAEIEGARGSKLRQTSTEAVRVAVTAVGRDGGLEEVDWTYAYLEFAERGWVDEGGTKTLFEGFLGHQAAKLFEVTKRR